MYSSDHDTTDFRYGNFTLAYNVVSRYGRNFTNSLRHCNFFFSNELAGIKAQHFFRLKLLKIIIYIRKYRKIVGCPRNRRRFPDSTLRGL